MQQTNQKVKDLINIITDRFPDENDLKGFPGISRALILEMLTQSDGLLISLKEHDNNFETIILKRELANVFENLFSELDEKFDKIKGDKFNSILKLISKLRFLVRETYTAVINTAPIRTEAEIAKAKEELTLLSSNNEELKRINAELITLKDTTIKNIEVLIAEAATSKNATVKINEEVTTLKDSANIIVADFETKHKTAIDNEKTITAFLGTIETRKTEVEAIQKNLIVWEADIKAAKESLASKVSEFDTLNEKSKAIQAEIENTHEKIFGKKDAEGKPAGGYRQETEDLKNKIQIFLTEQQTKFSTQFKEIESLLPGATSTGLAEAYQKQKKSYSTPLLIWSGVFILSIVLMTSLGAYLIYMQLQTTTESTLESALISLLKDLPFFIPTIWMAAYASKQQSQYKSLQQEYAFKETNAKSFHGHKIQIEQLMKDGGTDTDLLSQLVAQLVIITAYNPSETLDNKTHEDSPPILKLVEKYFPSFGKK